jgi:hypothetical protein
LTGKSSSDIEKIKKEDPFLTEEEKSDIEATCNYLEEKPMDALKKLYTNNYDEELSKNVNKKEIMEKIYIKERTLAIEKNWHDKIKLVPLQYLSLTKSEKKMLEEKKTFLEGLEYWSLYIHYKSAFPEESENLEISKEDMLEKIMNREKEKKEKIKIYQYMGISVEKN